MLSSARVTGLLRDGDRPDSAVVGVRVADLTDGSSFTVRARSVIAATGVWSDDIGTMLGDSAPNLEVRASKGVHLVVPRSAIDGGSLAKPSTRVSAFYTGAKSKFLRRMWKKKTKLKSLDVLREKLLEDPAGNKNVHQDKIFTTDVKEVWFIGGHCGGSRTSAYLCAHIAHTQCSSHADVGGGAVPDTHEYLLSDIPLRWMVREVMLAQCGVLFDNTALREHHISPVIGDIFAAQSVTPLGSKKKSKVQRTLFDYSGYRGSNADGDAPPPRKEPAPLRAPPCPCCAPCSTRPTRSSACSPGRTPRSGAGGC